MVWLLPGVGIRMIVEDEGKQRRRKVHSSYSYAAPNLYPNLDLYSSSSKQVYQHHSSRPRSHPNHHFHHTSSPLIEPSSSAWA
jgi:hypothetical protein